jgi:hypothetical protein
MNTFDKDWANKMSRKLDNRFKGFNNDRYVQTLFDPVQTHALYGLTKETIDSFKKQLKELGANRFRTVSTRFGFKILCFSAKKIAL